MKHYFSLMALFFILISYGQQEVNTITTDSTKAKKKVFSLGFSTGYNTFFGNNFIAKTYTPKLPICVDARFNIYKDFGLGFYYNFNNASLKTDKYVGNSTSGVIRQWGFYAAYFMPLTEKWKFIPRVGIGTFSLKNRILEEYGTNTSYYYYTNGTTYFIAPEIDYFLTDDISLQLNVEYGYIALPDVKASSVLGTSFTSSNELFIGIGVNFWL